MSDTSSTGAAEVPPNVAEELDEIGFTIWRGVLEEDVVEGAREACTELVDRAAHQLFAFGEVDDVLADEPFETRILKLDGGERKKCFSGYRAELHLPQMFALLFHERLLDVAEMRLGGELRLYPNYTVRPKMPDVTEQVVLWHQDAGYTERDHAQGQDEELGVLRMMNLWTPLVPATVENGCMQMVPGSHKLGVVEHDRVTASMLRIVPEVLKPLLPAAVDIELDPGDVVMFSNLMFHQGLPNHSRTVRWSVDWRYQDTTQATMRETQGHIARSRSNPESAVQSSEEWGALKFQ